MPNPLARARWLAPALLLAACSRPDIEARLADHQRLVDPPALWRVESLGVRGEVTAALLVCADSTVAAGFGRANAELNGRPCIPLKGGVDRPGLYAERCQVEGRRYGLTMTKSGDPARDFTAVFAFRALDGPDGAARQTRRFRRTGQACPSGWEIGDQARVGGAQGVNSLAGTWNGL